MGRLVYKSIVSVYTNAGNGKHPDYETMIEMVSNAMKSVTPDVIRTSFNVCRIAPYDQDVPIDELNQRLRTVIPNDLISNNDEERITVDVDLDDDSSCDVDYFDRNEDTADLFGGTLSHLIEETDNVNDDIINDLINEVSTK